MTLRKVYIECSIYNVKYHELNQILLEQTQFYSYLIDDFAQENSFDQYIHKREMNLQTLILTFTRFIVLYCWANKKLVHACTV